MTTVRVAVELGHSPVFNSLYINFYFKSSTRMKFTNDLEQSKDGEKEKCNTPTLTNLTHGYGRPKERQNEFLQSLGKPHVDSFNNFINHGLQLIAKNLTPTKIYLPNGDIVTVSIHNLFIDYPTADKRHVFPTECRQSGGTYSAILHGVINWSINGGQAIPVKKNFGEIPIMVKSERCRLKGLKPSELIKHNEHEDEWGGYFIISGHERLIRMLCNTRRNYPIAVCRRSWKTRCKGFTDIGILIRSVAEDETCVNNTLHYLSDGTVRIFFNLQKSLFHISLCMILKCLLNVTDLYIFKRLIQGYEDDLYYKSCVRKMLQNLHVEGTDTHEAAKNYVSQHFRIRCPHLREIMLDNEICDYILKNCLLIHLNDYEDKFNMLVFMVQKLYSLVQKRCCLEGTDAVMCQEVLTGGSIYQQHPVSKGVSWPRAVHPANTRVYPVPYKQTDENCCINERFVVKEKLELCLNNIRMETNKRAASRSGFTLNQLEMAGISHRAGNMSAAVKNFLATGNITTRFSISLPQSRGLTIIAENINRMRYMSHFKSIHRGAHFATMRTTEPRALLPDSWGFICPVHTPDGAPCGLLNHLTKYCQVSSKPDEETVKNIPRKLYDLGVIPIDEFVVAKDSYVVLLDGRVIGFMPQGISAQVVSALRTLKIEGKELPETTEIALVPKRGKHSQFPGLFLFTGPGRLIRPVKNLALNKTEFIGTFEQVYMDICIKYSEAYPGRTTHQELCSTSFLSNLASLIPMPDCNQSPRNIYQCQMGKQSMGTPCHNWEVQSDTKLYRLLFPASPLFRPSHYDDIQLDDFAMGLNAVVAVISYTGYDMEDAMIINKSSYERGFGHGSIVKSEFIQLPKESYFERDATRPELVQYLDEDGLVQPGLLIGENDPIYCYYDRSELKYISRKYHGKESAYVDSVKVFENDKGTVGACITFRIPRNPAVGDKFASRAGQKGICSQLWPTEDLPFTDTGMVPDIIFNPHGFPSRMTIAMMIELMAGKSAAVEGKVYDATPFQFSQENTAINYFGKMLESAGYSYYGTEKMYSGTNGREMEAEIFFGIVYYQRLRHMVLDKWQVRSTGPMDPVTQQPVQGRKRGGGIRVGEMERDAIISHGASSIVNDRLLDCSDRYRALICRKCNCLLSSAVERCPKTGVKKEVCRKCVDGGEVCTIEIPYILRYLLIQLAAFNINVKALLN